MPRDRVELRQALDVENADIWLKQFVAKEETFSEGSCLDENYG